MSFMEIIANDIIQKAIQKSQRARRDRINWEVDRLAKRFDLE